MKIALYVRKWPNVEFESIENHRSILFSPIVIFAHFISLYTAFSAGNTAFSAGIPHSFESADISQKSLKKNYKFYDRCSMRD